MTTAVIGIVSVVIGALVTGVLAHYREKGNRENALKLKELEIEGQKQQKWLNAREEAYAELANITSTIPTEQYVVTDLAQALAKVQMLSNSSLTTNVAKDLVLDARAARRRSRELRKQGIEPGQDTEARELINRHRETHAAFIAAARTELFGAPYDALYGRWVPDEEIGAPLDE